MPLKQICFDARMLSHGGIGTYIRNLLPGLKSAGFRLRAIVHPQAIAKESWLGEYDPILSSAPIYSIREQIELPLLIPRTDVFFSPHYNVPLGPIRAKKRVVTVHDVCHLALSSDLRWYERLYANQVINYAVKKSDAVITDSQFSLSEICKYMRTSPHKINVIHCGVDHDLFQKSDDQNRIAQVIAKYSLPKRYFLFVGNLKPHKNLRGILLAMKHLIEEDQSLDISMVIVGKSEGMKHVDIGWDIYQNNPGLRERVCWLSSVSNTELPIFYQLAEALVFPSYYEGFGLPALEAMSCGCPVIASKAASLPEVCGSAAVYISPENFLEIASVMKEVLESQKAKKKLVEKGLVHARRFGWESAITKHIELLEADFKLAK